MNCNKCKAKTKVIDKRNTKTYTRRRRECLKCGQRFTTTEVLATTAKKYDWFGKPLRSS
jgi:transcriptional regulator NrdR family protein